MSIFVGKVPTPGAVLREITFWLKTHDKIRWTLIFSLVCTVCYIINTGPVWAAPDETSNASTLFLPLGGITDSHGVPISRYIDLPMDPGNATHPMRSIRYTIASILWPLYMGPVMLVIGMLEWVLQFEWLSWLSAPFLTVTNGAKAMLNTWMLIPFGLLVSALYIGIGYVRGRTGAATAEFAMVVLVFGLIASPFANPLSWVAGSNSGNVASNGGLIKQVADTGAQAGGLTVNSNADTDNISVAGSVIDITLRNPMLTMSFGSPLKGECESAWNEKASDASLSPDEIRKAVIKCDEEVAKANQTDGYTWLVHYLMAWPAMIGVMCLIAVFLGFMLYQIVQVLIGSVVSVIRGFMAVFPGRSREAWFNSLFQVVISAMLVGVFIWALIVYMWILTKIVGSIPPGFTQVGAILTGILVLIMTFTFWKMKKSGKSVGERIATAFGRNGLGKNAPDRRPSKFGSTVGNLTKSAVGQGMNMQQNRKLLAAARAARVAATVGTGGAAGVAAKVGAGVVATAASKKAIKAVAAKKAPLALGTSAGGPAMAGLSTPPGGPNLPQFSVGMEGAQGGEGIAPLPMGSSLNSPSAAPLEGTVAMAKAGLNDFAGEPATAMPNAAHSHRTNRIPENNYGGTWVHKNGHIHRPVTVTPEGKQVQNVPSEEKISRSLRNGDAWVISPDIRPRPNAEVGQPAGGIQRPVAPDSASQPHKAGHARHSSLPANAAVETPATHRTPFSKQQNTPVQRTASAPRSASAPVQRTAPAPRSASASASAPRRDQGSAARPAAAPSVPQKPKAMKPRPSQGGSE